ncbi:cinnamoyl-CoA reductase CAD2-like isoform X2 [Cicer arietinum]|uniref:cinnamoyl-CoA reductase CAD2-like isoform X2 n=1 Tax=Cicer arietinum TaxID=3827 RepID=UPI003CC56EA6
MSSGEGKVVCVTGASGFIASWIVKFLLQRGYTVRGTVRDPSNPKKVDHLLKLMVQRRGCSFLRQISWKKVELIDPALKGTLNVLKSCARSPSVKRVILTSSVSAVKFSSRPITPEVVVDETWFSDPDFCRESELWYTLSKTLAEAAAWKFVNENNIDMVVINPSMVVGPLLQPEINESVEPILNLINGVPFPNDALGWLDVKDVADAHILAYEIASANGRYCVAERVVHYSEIARILRDLYPTIQISDKCENDEPYEPPYQISKEKASSLGVKFTPLEVALKDTVESFREKNILDF